MPQQPPPSPSTPSSGALSLRDAESLFRSKPISEIRSIESSARSDAAALSSELRRLVGRSYRDLIDSADSILLMSKISSSISSNLSSISSALLSLSPSSSLHHHHTSVAATDPARSRVYSLAARVKYLIDSPENIWGRLDDSMLLEAAGRYLRARHVSTIISSDHDVLHKFPLLGHQLQIVDTFKPQISQKTHDRLFSSGELPTVSAAADALAAAAIIDDLTPQHSLYLFLRSRRHCISQHLGTSAEPFASILSGVVKIIKVTLGQTGQLFFPALNERPMFYKTVLGSPPGTHLFGGIPDPEEEVKLWKLRHEKLESSMVELEPEFIAKTCSDWLRGCCDEILSRLLGGRQLVDTISSGEELVSAEKLVREVLHGRDGLESSLEEWLRSVFGSEIESPWNLIRGLILKDGEDILENRLEDAFLTRMKRIVDSGFEELKGEIRIKNSIEAIGLNQESDNDFRAYSKNPSLGGGMWFSDPSLKKAGPWYSLKPVSDDSDFKSCLNAYFGPDVSRIRDAVDRKCGSILEEVLSFVESHNSTLRLQQLAPYLQDKCYNIISSIMKELEDVLGGLETSLQNRNIEMNVQPAPVIVERSLFVGRLLFALRNHSIQIPLILGSPRQWVKDAVFAHQLSPSSMKSKGSVDYPMSFSPRRATFDSPRSPGSQFAEVPRRLTIQAAAKLFQVDDNTNRRLDELNKTLQGLCIKAHNLWIQWVSDELAIILSADLNKDDSLSSTTTLRGWEVTVIKHEDNSDESAAMKIALPSMPSLYVTNFLFQACVQIHKVGGHILDKIILQNFAWRLLQKVVSIYGDFLSAVEAGQPQVSDKGALQVLLDLHFAADVLAGGKSCETSDSSETNRMELKSPFRRRSSEIKPSPAGTGPVMGLLHRLSQRLDPIDWATYEPYLWENEKQTYKRHSVLFGFFVQLNRLHTDIVQKLPTKSNTDSNILRCSTVPRFKYLPISAPALSSRAAHKSNLQTSASEISSRSPWNAYSNGEQSPKPEYDDSMSFGVATPLLKSFMTQVGSKFGESTSRLGSILADGQVSKLSPFGDILPVPAAGFLSSLTSGAPKLDT